MPALAGHWLRENFNVARWSVTKTLYNYVTLGLLGKIKSIDCPCASSEKNARKRVRERKKKFGRSIDERDPSVDERQISGIGSVTLYWDLAQRTKYC